jgi:hypothetical protein
VASKALGLPCRRASAIASSPPSGRPALPNCSTCLTRPDADRAALIGRLHQRKDAAWLAELLITSRGFPHAGTVVLVAVRERELLGEF